MSVRLTTIQILVLIGTVGVSPQMGEILPLCDFLTVLTFFLDPAPRSNRWTDFHALRLKRRVFRTRMVLFFGGGENYESWMLNTLSGK